MTARPDLPSPHDRHADNVRIAPARVVVHLARLSADRNAAGASSLPDVDRQRAAAIRCVARRNEFLETRRLLRQLIATRLNCPLSDVSIVSGADGKPRLAGGEIEFSVSHRYPWCAIALSTDCPVGVDVEPVRRFSDMQAVVRRFFPLPARKAFAAATPQQQLTVFFRWWTRIEAALKAAGHGLDAAASCLDGVVYESSENVKGLALAVAAKNTGSLVVDWHTNGQRS